ncbi:hypothetical protein F4808DRAFT_236332 [Astrocystis sublimbata]|nr:hypothetical protein F4808DRAFT_236332 [Astrocystis sublimbata]
MAPTVFSPKACVALIAASLASVASAQDASVNPFDLTDYYIQRKMTLMIETTENAPYGTPFDVVPMTIAAGLEQPNDANTPDVNGHLVILDYTNFTRVDYAGRVVYLSCDPSTTGTDSNLITPDRMLNSIMSSARPPDAILLYSTTKPICVVGGEHLTYTNVWTMASQEDALEVHKVITSTSADQVDASIIPNQKAMENQQPHPGSTSAIAMSILYSITGLITLLFLLIIATGAVRAHRNPERYGPRAGVNGRPRRSRARGLAMAMLETLPIVKFGENDDRKHDEETALEGASSRVQTELQNVPHGEPQNSPNHDAAPESSSEAAKKASLQNGPEIAHAETVATSDNAKQEPTPVEENPGCSICTEDFTKGEDVRVLPCDHKFHPACVDPWLVNVSGTCPLCRLDLRPPEETEHEENDEAAVTPDIAGATSTADGHLAPPAGTDAAGEATHRRRRSRLLDWNRLRQASVDERLQALRQYRQSQQGADDERRHSRLTDRLRERLHIRSESRSESRADTAATSTSPSPSPAPEASLPAASTAQH